MRGDYSITSSVVPFSEIQEIVAYAENRLDLLAKEGQTTQEYEVQEKYTNQEKTIIKEQLPGNEEKLTEE